MSSRHCTCSWAGFIPAVAMNELGKIDVFLFHLKIIQKKRTRTLAWCEMRFRKHSLNAVFIIIKFKSCYIMMLTIRHLKSYYWCFNIWWFNYFRLMRRERVNLLLIPLIVAARLQTSTHAQREKAYKVCVH